MHGSTWLDSCLGVFPAENKACKTFDMNLVNVLP